MECLVCWRQSVVETVATALVSPDADLTLKEKAEEVLGHTFEAGKKSQEAGEWFCDACTNLLRDLCVKEIEVESIRRGIRQIYDDRGNGRKNVESLSNKPSCESGDGPFICPPCGAFFDRSGELSAHLETHDQKPFVCLECKLSFKHAESLKSHQEKCHPLNGDGRLEAFDNFLAADEDEKPDADASNETLEENEFCCDSCNSTFKVKFLLDEHVQKHHSNRKKRSCPKCKKEFRDGYHLRRHLRTHEEKIREDREEEADAFDAFIKLPEDESGKLPDIALICNLCEGKTFPTVAAYEDHRKAEHDGEGKLKCPEPGCDKSFTYKKGLNRHMKEHVGGPKYACEHCIFKTYRLDRFKEHLLTHASGSKNPENALDASNSNKCEDEEEGDYQLCVICRKLISKKFMPIHLKNHTSNYEVSCDVCSRQFKSRKLMTAHRKRHLDKKGYVCAECGKAFCDKSGLNSHLKSHAKLREHVCEVCGKAFLRAAHLRDHLACHTGTRRFFCKQCDFGATTLWKLGNHERTHSGEKPFLCVTCGRGFAQKSNLDAHARIHTGLKPYPCQLCDKAFDRKKKYEDHLTMVHAFDTTGNASPTFSDSVENRATEETLNDLIC